MNAETTTEITRGPTTPDGPSVDDLRKARRGYEETTRRVTDHAVIRGKVVNNDPGGEISERDGKSLRGIVTLSRHMRRPDPESYTEVRDPKTKQVVRTYEDGRVERRD
ncbi:hypothetical protein C5L38_09250 [Streptomyces sp. WAC00288]|uniref:hypothetical protein n=1 Tax=unclassified Streptomyces TaxID=2593676 RepID=UPI000788F5E1|nr:MULTISPECIES: hypothetical protein [unclassified Streptomyces]AVH95236.1 hypothetical protein C5L38_09250 [Streptomyces sp. WAC00288]KYG53930.1 hypothetical protein AWI43_05135 [Streptomyces sp. WAC04657]